MRRNRPVLQPMETAPRDGSRIILKAVLFGWDSDIAQHVAIGDHYIEARWSNGMSGVGDPGWHEWCGNDRMHSTTGRLVGLGWIPRPPEVKKG